MENNGIKNLGTLTKANRQPGDVHPKKPDLVWTEYKPGKFDWRKNKSGSKKTSGSSSSKNKTKPKSQAEKFKRMKAAIEKTDTDKLKRIANNPGNSPEIRKLSYNELVIRDEDVSDIDMNTGKVKTMNQQKQIFSENEEADSLLNDEDADTESEMTEEEMEEETEWSNPDWIKKKFGGLKTKMQRIAADKFVHKKKIKQPNYIPPEKEIHDLNATYYRFLKSDSPLLIASGGAGVGKSYNFHKIAEIAGKKAFDPATDEPGDGDYDYFEAPEIKSEAQLASLLKEHNGKVILFDDADNVLKTPDTLGLMKKATASSGKRIVGKKSTQKNSNVDPFEFTGKIAFLTNMTQDDLTKNPNIDAIYSRATKKDIQFTKREQLSFISRLKHLAEFTGLERLDDPKEDEKEREEVFQIIAEEIDNIDPDRFNSRTFKEALEKKRATDDVNADIFDGELDDEQASLFFGEKKDWKKQVRNLLSKGQGSLDEDNLIKAYKHFSI